VDIVCTIIVATPIFVADALIQARIILVQQFFADVSRTLALQTPRTGINQLHLPLEAARAIKLSR